MSEWSKRLDSLSPTGDNAAAVKGAAVRMIEEAIDLSGSWIPWGDLPGESVRARVLSDLESHHPAGEPVYPRWQDLIGAAKAAEVELHAASEGRAAMSRFLEMVPEDLAHSARGVVSVGAEVSKWAIVALVAVAAIMIVREIRK